MSNLRKYNIQNPKDRFMVEKLLEYLLATIDSQVIIDKKNELIRRIARMEIYPYIASNGDIYLGSLVDDKISWFYLSDIDQIQGHKSSKNYRILASKVLPKDVFLNLVRTFGPSPYQSGYIELFSNEVVINALLEEMSIMTDYTEEWWQAAKDIYKLSENKTLNITNYRRASEHIYNDYFLFDQAYCDNEHKKLLLSLGVFKDIEEHPGYKQYINSFPDYYIEKAKQHLSRLGVPNRFTYRGRINGNLRKLFSGVGEYVSFPCDASLERDMRLCELSHYVVFSVIVQDDPEGYSNIIRNESYWGGIAVPNRLGSYTSLNYSLFYGDLLDSEKPVPEPAKNLEALHLVEDPPFIPFRGLLYGDTRVQSYADSFDSIEEPFSEYHIGQIRTKEMLFYQWAWSYTNNTNLADNIFNYLSNIKTTYIDESYNSFVLQVLNRVEYNSLQAYSFQMKFSADEALGNREILNKHGKNEFLRGIIPVVTDYLTRIDTLRIRYDILNVLTCDDETRQSIDQADFWNRVYWSEDKSDEEGFVRVSYYVDGIYEPERIILISAKRGEENIQLMDYISDEYGIKFESIASTKRDWREDYRDLTYGIRNFISTFVEKSTDVLFENTAIHLDDLETSGKELTLWSNLKLSRDAILSYDGKTDQKPDIQIWGWSDFLKEKYQNHCQVCGNLIPEEVSESYYRFRIHSHSKNLFSDIASNVFCLCPTCHGDMQFGLVKRDLREISRLANRYLVKLLKEDEVKVDNNEQSIISTMASNGNYVNAFVNPVICPICINGKQEHLHFSWEHFLRLAIMFYDDDKDYTYEGEIGNLMQLLRMLSSTD